MPSRRFSLSRAQCFYISVPSQQAVKPFYRLLTSQLAYKDLCFSVLNIPSQSACESFSVLIIPSFSLLGQLVSSFSPFFSLSRSAYGPFNVLLPLLGQLTGLLVSFLSLLGQLTGLLVSPSPFSVNLQVF